MKQYIIPTETLCNAKCRFCITQIRKSQGILPEKEFLDIASLEKALKLQDIEKIEITGGGEPALNKSIEAIIDLCAQRAKTQLYTNGKLAGKISNLEKLYCLCISRAHYDDEKNQEIMGINYDLKELLQRNIPVKLSLMLHKSGICTPEEFLNYVDWAKQHNVKKVVARQMIDADYEPEIKKEFVSCKELFSRLNIKEYKIASMNPVFSINKMKIEFEYQDCCASHISVVHADGSVKNNWG